MGVPWLALERSPFSPQEYFDLCDERLRPLFEVERVWEALLHLEAFIDRELRPGLHGRVMSGAWVGEDVELAEGALVEAGAYVEGPAIIGKGAVIRHGAYVRAYSYIAEGAVVGHASEVKRSILMPGAHAPHFNYVGDSVLGAGVNLGAGTKISNLKHDGSLVQVEWKGRRHSTGLRKFGAVIGDEASTGCNCVTQPGALIGPGTITYPNAVLRGVYPPRSIVKLRQSHEVVTRRLD